MNIFKKFLIFFFIFSTLLIIPNSSFSQSKDWKENVPDELKPWINWVLKDYKENPCPFYYSDDGVAGGDSCGFPTSLKIIKNEDRLNFYMDFYNYKGGNFNIIGDRDNWPFDVKVNGNKKDASNVAGMPRMFLEKGLNRVTGFLRVKDEITIPKNIAIVNVYDNNLKEINSKVVKRPSGPVAQEDFYLLQINNKNQEEITQKKEVKEEQDSIKIQVFREVFDTIPFKINTYLKINVSGKERDINLGKIVFPDSFLYEFKSDVPVKRDEEGNFIFHFKDAGVYNFSATSIFKDIKEKFSFLKSTKDFPDNEIWIYNLNNLLRQTNVKGASFVDPTQIQFPDGVASKRGALYYINFTKNDTLSIKEKTRAPSKGGVEKHETTRHIWIDFDGNGYTSKDEMRGGFNKNGFLVANEDIDIKQAIINGKNVPIIATEKDDVYGVYVEKGNASIVSEARGKDISKIDITPWDKTSQRSKMILELPTGWSVFHITNTSNNNSDSKSWVSSWTLLNIFYTIFTVVIISKTTSKKLGLLSFVCILLFQNNFAKINITSWLFSICAFLFLSQIFEKFSPNTSSICKGIKNIIYVAFIIYILLFIFQDIRHITSPYPYYSLQTADEDFFNNEMTISYTISFIICFVFGIAKELKNIVKNFFIAIVLFVVVIGCLIVTRLFEVNTQNNYRQRTSVAHEELEYQRVDSYSNYASVDSSRISNAGSKAMGLMAGAPSANKQENIKEFEDKYLNTSTGVGMPQWKGAIKNISSLSYTWNNPVTSDKKVNIYFISYKLNIVICILRIIAIIWILCLFSNKNIFTKFSNAMSKFCIIFICLFSFMFISAKNSFAEIPSKEMLNELKTYAISNIQKGRSCKSNCVLFRSLKIEEKQDGSFNLGFNINIQEDGVVPIMTQDFSHPFRVKKILVNNKKVLRATFDHMNSLSLLLKKGTNKVDILISINSKVLENNAISFYLKNDVLSTSYNLSSYEQVKNENPKMILLRKLVVNDNKKKEEKVVGEVGEKTNVEILSLYNIKRQIDLSHEFNVVTTIERQGGLANATTVDYDLIDGEKILTKGVDVKDKKCSVVFKEGEREKVINSTLPKVNIINLVASNNKLVYEKWEIKHNNMYDISYEGTPLIEDSNINYWAPRQGESLKVNIKEFKSKADAPTLTITNSELTYSLGKDLIEATLKLDINSSYGGSYKLKLPANSKEISVYNNNVLQPFTNNEESLKTNLVQGKQALKINWKIPFSWKTFFVLPRVDLGQSSLNSYVQVNNINSRLLFFVKGTKVSPIIFFWVVFVAMVLVSLAIKKSRKLDIKFWQLIFLFLGLALTFSANIFIILIWLLLGYVVTRDYDSKKNKYVMVLYFIVSVIFFFTFIHSIRIGLGDYTPSMYIHGFGSSDKFGMMRLNFYEDMISGLTPKIILGTISNFAYHVFIIIWSLWASFFLINNFIKTVKNIINKKNA